jgi:hypothetical protein
LNPTSSLLADIQEYIKEYGAERVLEVAAAWRAMGEPEELCRRLDTLVENFSAKVGNPTPREKLSADVEELKSKFLEVEQLTPEKQRDVARTITVEASRMMSHNEKSQKWIEEQLRELDEATNPQEVAARVNLTLELWKRWEVSQLARKHNVPEEMMEECGLTVSPEARQYIPTDMLERWGLTASP